MKKTDEIAEYAARFGARAAIDHFHVSKGYVYKVLKDRGMKAAKVNHRIAPPRLTHDEKIKWVERSYEVGVAQTSHECGYSPTAVCEWRAIYAKAIRR